MGETVNTVTGPVSVDRLGTTLMHEHVCMGSEGLLLDSRVHVDPDERFAHAVRRLTAAKDAGVTTIVDATPIELNRDVAFLREVSEASGVTIVCATGVYMETHGLPAHFRHMPVDDLRDLFVHEIRESVGRTGVRAGVIKVATAEAGVSEVNRKTLEAAAAAQAQTGVPIITHTSAGHGVEQAKTLTGAGATPAKVMIGHVDHKYSSFSYFERILRTGVNIAFDRCGLEIFLPDRMRAAMIAGLVQIGLQQRLFLSMDSVCFHLGEKSAYEADGHEPLVYLMTTFAKLLEEAGVSREVQTSILTDNPARLFGAMKEPTDV
jgi:phosphotriesterase-related protein